MSDHERADDRRRRLAELFSGAWGLAPEERSRYLEKCRRDDPLLVRDVEDLIAESESAEGLFTAESPATELSDALVEAARGAGGSGVNGGNGVDGEGSDGRRLLDLAVGPQPERIGRYIITRLIAIGGMGAVYEARQESPSRLVALKIPREPLLSADAARRFRDEAEILARLQHPGIAQVYEAGVFRREGVHESHPPHPYLAMELVRGVSITQYAEDHGLALADRVRLVAEACDAVQHAHQRGIIHRDLKPANIFVDEGGRIKVLDFGIARLVERDGAMHQTEAGRILGTPAYMSPEQLEAQRTSGDIDTRTDVFSLGVVLLEMLTGEAPRALEESGSTGGARGMRRIGGMGALRSDLARVAEHALARDREMRYQSVADLAGDLRRVLRSEPIMARRPNAAYILGRFVGRHRAGVAAGTAVALVCIIFLALASVRIVQAEREAREQYAVARGTVDFLINEVIADLDGLSGTQPINRRMMERLVTHSAAMLEQKPDDPQLQANHAMLLFRIANLEQGEGHRDRAIGMFQDALAIQSHLVDRYPDEPDYRMQLAINYVLLGDLGVDQQEMYQRALEIDRQLVAQYPESRRYFDNLGYSYERIARLHHLAGAPQEAEPLLRRRLEIARELMARYPDNSKSALGLCVGNVLMSETMKSLERHEDAVVHARAAVEACDLLQGHNPHHLWYTRWCVRSLITLARAETAVGNTAVAAEHFDRAMIIIERITKENPDDAWWHAIRSQFVRELEASGGP